MSNQQLFTRRELIKKGSLAITALAFHGSLITFKTMEKTKKFDVIIIGGSYAGLSAAMALGRSLKNVLIIDGGNPCNKQTPHSHNFITQDGEQPDVISKKAREQVLSYPFVSFLSDFAIHAEKINDGFEVATRSGLTLTGKKLVFATGVKDILPDLKGFSECWGISAIHCPYCHGYEYRGKKTGIMANGEKAFHLASLINNLTDNSTILTSGPANFTPEQFEKLEKHNITVIETVISEIEHENGHVKHVVFRDETKLKFDVVYAAVSFRQHSDIPAALGCEITEQGHLKTDVFQKTTVEGVFACGDASNMMRSVAYAVASGNITGAMVNRELTNEQF